ncbi:Na+/H+ antiporter NhaC family protein [Enterocloster asparagiformis]|uniref:Na+/H+ antiporter NhaC family protein n=1 Tax=Enterocloster asparagiformis TaxID=333367 RepID=UPI0034B2CF3E
MLETVSLAAFMIGLFVCLLSGISIVYALMAGYLIFFGYGLVRGHSAAELLRMSGSGVRKVRNILITFGLIGMLTALWRAAGTIPAVVSYSSQLIRPSAFFMFVFLLNCLVSVLTGTSLGTAATMGVICMAIGSATRMSPVISGAYFGDRCSPVSTSALLVCELTGTDIYDNIRRMAASSVLPLGLTCLLYYLMGIAGANGGVTLNVRPIFERGFVIHWLAVLPAAVILALSVFKVKVRMTLSVSIAVAFLTGMFLQHTGPLELLKTAVYGYRAADPELAAMMNGGGMMSMVRLAVIITISSSYAGLFEGTHLLDHLKLHMEEVGRSFTLYGGMLFATIVVAAIACNQTLTIILVHQLFCGQERERGEMAVNLENTAVVVAPLIPWSIAAAAPLASIGATPSSLLAACYLYLLPLCCLIGSLIKRRPESAARVGMGFRPLRHS